MARDFTAGDKGKKVMTADGDMVGTIERIAGGNAHVKPDTSLSSSIRNRLGWADEDKSTYRLDKSKVDSFSGDEVHLRKNL
jgi:hypothetical protein